VSQFGGRAVDDDRMTDWTVKVADAARSPLNRE
jgi:hypothetical protein